MMLHEKVLYKCEKKIYLVGFVLIIFFSCQEKIAKFLFDSSKINMISKYEYEYELTKLKSKTTRFYTLMYGSIIDSMISKTTYIYNTKGAVVKEITNSLGLNNPDIEIFDYDNKDSLTFHLYINTEGDTTLLERFAIFPDGRKAIFRKTVVLKMNPNLNFKDAFDNKTYDTIISRYEYTYNNNLCTLLKEFDKNDILIKVVV